MNLRVYCVFATLLMLCACEGERKIQINGSTMGTYYRVIGFCAQAPSRNEIEQRLETLNAVFSNWRDDSTVSRFNEADPIFWFPVEPELAQVAENAKEISVIFNSKFDITVLPAVEIWGFSAKSVVRKPTEAEIERALLFVGHEQLEVRLNPPALRKKTPLRIDVSGIAKGFAVDQLAELFESKACRNYLVDIGGEIRVRGRNAEDRLWNIAIEFPDGSGDVVMGEGDIYTSIRLPSGAVATSGEYRNFRFFGDERVSHIIDPTTGRPVSHNVSSVTVYAPTATEADALATGLFVLGPDALDYAERNGIAMIMFMWSEEEKRHVATISSFMEVILDPLL